MILLLDAGNTAIKWGVWQEGSLVLTGSFRHRDEDFPSVAREAWYDLPTPAGVVVANVGGDRLGGLISAWTTEHWNVTPVFVGTTASAGGVVNAYPRPANLGVDRWAALVGARHEYKDAVCVVDCGSAITVDLMDGDGRHRGGLIMPGIEMLKTLLLENTANIRLADPIPGVTLFAQDTGEAVSSGAAYMAVAALERIIAEMAATIAQHVDVVVTGGDAGQILSSLNIYARQDPDLVLKGLAVLSGDD